MQPSPGDVKSAWLATWLRIDPSSKPRIYTQVYATTEISNAGYWLDIVLSAGIATLGLVLNSPAVIIGAMLISPLMGPIMATGLALAAGDLYLAFKAVANLLASVAVAILVSALIVWLLPFHSATSEILARTNPNLLDLGVALFSGLAGSIAVSRAGGGRGGTTLPGVAIAVALMPPLCTVGFGLGSGINAGIMGGAGLLFLTNLVAIVASAFLIFLLVGMSSPEIRTEMEHAREGEFFARKLAVAPWSRLLSNGGKLRWRVAMLVVLLTSVAIPLHKALLQVGGEAVARGAAQDAIRGLVPRGALVSQQVEVGRESIVVRLVSTTAISDEKLRSAEEAIQQRSGRKAQVFVASVVSQSEVGELMERLSTVPPSLPPPSPTQSLAEKSFANIQEDLIARVKPALSEVWPPEIPISDFELRLTTHATVLTVRYQAKKTLDRIAIDVIEKQLRLLLKDPTLSLSPERTSLPSEKH